MDSLRKPASTARIVWVPERSRRHSGTGEVSRFSCMLFLRVRGVYDYGGLDQCSLSASADVAFSVSLKDRRPRLGFRSSIPGPRMPLSTLQSEPHDSNCKTQGQDGLLFLSCRTLSFPATCGFIPALCLPPNSINCAQKELRIVRLAGGHNQWTERVRR